MHIVLAVLTYYVLTGDVRTSSAGGTEDVKRTEKFLRSKWRNYMGVEQAANRKVRYAPTVPFIKLAPP